MVFVNDLRCMSSFCFLMLLWAETEEAGFCSGAEDEDAATAVFWRFTFAWCFCLFGLLGFLRSIFFCCFTLQKKTRVDRFTFQIAQVLPFSYFLLLWQGRSCWNFCTFFIKNWMDVFLQWSSAIEICVRCTAGCPAGIRNGFSNMEFDIVVGARAWKKQHFFYFWISTGRVSPGSTWSNVFRS